MILTFPATQSFNTYGFFLCHLMPCCPKEVSGWEETAQLLNKLALINEDRKQYIISIRKWFKTLTHVYLYIHAITVPNYLLFLQYFWWIFSFRWMGYVFRSSMGAFNITTTISTSRNSDNDTAMKQQQSNSNNHETTRRNTSFQNTGHDWGPWGPKDKQEKNQNRKTFSKIL